MTTTLALLICAAGFIWGAVKKTLRAEVRNSSRNRRAQRPPVVTEAQYTFNQGPNHRSLNDLLGAGPQTVKKVGPERLSESQRESRP
jgi:hypothetical protein